MRLKMSQGHVALVGTYQAYHWHVALLSRAPNQLRGANHAQLSNQLSIFAQDHALHKLK